MCTTDNFLIVDVAVNDGRACYFTAFKNGHGLGSGRTNVSWRFSPLAWISEIIGRGALASELRLGYTTA
jgi:hypothetical protein